MAKKMREYTIYDGEPDDSLAVPRLGARFKTNNDEEQSIVFEWNKPKPFERECINTTEQGNSQSGIGNQDNNDDYFDVPSRIVSVCDGIKEMLLEKNRKYGNSALEPIRVFSHADTIEQIKVRMDDKLSRIRNQQSDEDEDVWRDLAGYIVLLIVAKGMGR